MVMAAGRVFGFGRLNRLMLMPAAASVRRVLVVVMPERERELPPRAERYGRGTEQGFFVVRHGVSFWLWAVM
jgi:hypothetical protein